MYMEIQPISIQSLQQISRNQGDYTERATRVYQDIGGKITVEEISYRIYNRRAEIEENHKQQVDLRV